MTRRKTPPPPLPALGWREWLALPALDVRHIKAKLDTGARSSAIHAFDIELFRRGKRDMVRFGVHPMQRSDEFSLSCEAEVIDERSVRSSMGASQRRLVIVTPVRVGDVEWPIEMTLTRRDQMGFRMLLGRQALARRFVVDPGRSFLGSSPPPKRRPNRKAQP